MSDKLAKRTEPIAAEPIDVDDIELGQWYWVSGDPEWLACVVYIGSNYVEMVGQSATWANSTSVTRVHMDDFDVDCRREPDAVAYIKGKVGEHESNTRALMGKIRELTARLGLGNTEKLANGGDDTSQALVVATGVADVKAHKNALILAKKETLPALFEEIKEQNQMMAAWMKAELIPLKAEANVLEKSMEAIDGRILTVSLYAGLVEELVQIAKGAPAELGTKIHLYQRRHYMDEECLLEYTAGGMEFKDLRVFDRWLVRKANRHRILPHPRSVVAFQVRRERKERENPTTMGGFIQIQIDEEADKRTFLYIRNGEQVFRLSTDIDFGPQLFPDMEHSMLLGKTELWVRVGSFDKVEIITRGEYEHKVTTDETRRKEYEVELKAWKKDPKNKIGSVFQPIFTARADKYTRVEPNNIHYDDAMKKVAQAVADHNRIAVVLQGLLDRSQAFHPHPNWQLWKAEGFEHALTLVFDDSRALVPGPPPDFEAYRARLNASLKVGSIVVGQEEAWLVREADRENKRQHENWRVRNPIDYRHYWPYGNMGPGMTAKIVRLSRDKTQATFQWERERLRPEKWTGNLTPITVRFTCPTAQLLNISAYTAGEFKQFYTDHRTRADYLKWASLLLTAEDYVGKKAKRKKKK